MRKQCLAPLVENHMAFNEGAFGVGKAPRDSSNSAWSELRQSPRIRCSGTVELQTEGSEVHLWGTLTDVSLHGCYVEMRDTFAVDTRVYLILKSLGIRIQTRGTVRTSFATLGMGIVFAEIEPGQYQQLQQLVDTLTGRATASKSLAHDSPTTMAVDPIAFLDEVTEFFRKKPLLSRIEFQEIARRVRRP
jgi:hypothetical protein